MYVETTNEYFNTMAAYEILGNILKDIELLDTCNFGIHIIVTSQSLFFCEM